MPCLEKIPDVVRLRRKGIRIKRPVWIRRPMGYFLTGHPRTPGIFRRRYISCCKTLAVFVLIVRQDERLVGHEGSVQSDVEPVLSAFFSCDYNRTVVSAVTVKRR